MTIQLWCACVHCDETPTPAHLLITQRVITQSGKAVPPVLCLMPGQEATPQFRSAIAQAHQLTLCTVGWPVDTTFEIRFRPGMNGLELPTPFHGDSHFGAVAIGLAQAVALTSSSRIRSGAQALLPILQSTSLERVAVSAAWNEQKCEFSPVGSMQSKLVGFCMPGLEPSPAICVTATDQDEQDEREKKLNSAGEGKIELPLPRNAELNYPMNGRGLLRCLPVRDPIEAFHHLWEAQTRSLARCL